MCFYFTYPFCDLRKKKHLEEQVVKKEVIVFASKIKKTKTHKPPSPERSQLQPYQKLRNISVTGLRIETRHHS